MSAQQLPASDIRGEESMEREGVARAAGHASSAINLSLFVCSKQKKKLPFAHQASESDIPGYTVRGKNYMIPC